MAYAKTVGQLNEVEQEEEARLLRVRIILLEHENEELHEQLAEEDDRTIKLDKQLEKVETRYNEAISNITLLKDALRTKNKEVESLEVSRVLLINV